ncbi:hypothetical protein SAMN05444050_4254 [Afipia sp. GAS231]|nr:hypothetical protein SAMN05444050_4254 [Afipia sp. GAS231]
MQSDLMGVEVTPNALGRTIKQFCEIRLNAAQPRYLPVRPTRYTASEYCHQAVAAQIEQEGGAARFGWIIREHPGLYLTARSYAVWEDTGGNLVDVTPNGIGQPRILFAVHTGSQPADSTMRHGTHFLRTFRPKTYGDYALEAAVSGAGESSQHANTDDGQPGVDDWTMQDDQEDPLAIAIDDFLMMSVCRNALITMTADGPVCNDPTAYELVSRTRSQCQKEMMRLWGHSLIRKADAQFLFDSAV